MTSSVTGCSTCSRVFISMKKNVVGVVVRDEELDGPGTQVADAAGDVARGRADAARGSSASSSGDGASSTTFWWRRCSEHSRSPRCTTPPWASASSCTSMCRGLAHEPLEQQGVVAERRGGHPACRREGVAQVLGPLHHGHALAPAARRRLDQQRVARARPAAASSRRRPRRRPSARGSPARPAAATCVLRADLVAHDLERLAHRARRTRSRPPRRRAPAPRSRRGSRSRGGSRRRRSPARRRSTASTSR